jgi:hypothetical protein
VRVTTVNDNVTLLEVGLELGNKVVDGLAGLDEENDAAGALQVLAELLDGAGANNVGALGLVLEEVVDLGGGTLSSAFVSHSQATVRPSKRSRRAARAREKG